MTSTKVLSEKVSKYCAPQSPLVSSTVHSIQYSPGSMLLVAATLNQISLVQGLKIQLWKSEVKIKPGAVRPVKVRNLE